MGARATVALLRAGLVSDPPGGEVEHPTEADVVPRARAARGGRTVDSTRSFGPSNGMGRVDNGPLEVAPDPALLRRFRAFARLAGAAVLALGVAVLTGWLADIAWLKDPLGHFVRMSPMSASLFVASGASLSLSMGPPEARGLRAVARALGALLSLLGLAALALWARGVSPTVLNPIPSAASPAPISVSTAASFAVLGAALALLEPAGVRDRRVRAAEVLGLLGLAPGLLTIGGLVYGAQQFYVGAAYPTAVGMSMHGAVGLVVLVLGVLSARPGSGALAVLASPHVGGRVARRAGVFLFALPVVDFFGVLGQRAGLYRPPGSAVVAAVTGVLLGASLVLRFGATLDASDALRRRREQELLGWKQSFDGASFGAVFGSVDGRFVRVNEVFARMHGYTVAELEGQPIVSVFPEDRRDELARNIALAYERGCCRWESEHLRNDGSVFPVAMDMGAVRDEHGQVLYRATYIQDITADKQADAERSRLAALVESADDAIVAKALDGTVLAGNRGAERVYGYTAAEMLGRSIEVTVPEERRAERAMLGARVRVGEMVLGFETVRVRKDGAGSRSRSRSRRRGA